MYIDFHTHAYADKIAKRTIDALVATAKMPCITDGTVAGLVSALDKNGVEKAVVLPIATKPSQHEVVNSWAKQIESDRLIPFGSVHPFGEDAIEYIEKIKESGLKGIKLHPDYQGFEFDDKNVYPIYKKCAQLGLIVIIHAGYDPVSPDKIHATPRMIANVMNDIPDLTLVCGHLGGMNLWDEVYETLAGNFESLYFDTAFVSSFIDFELFEKIVRKHGAQKILLASDMPWENTKNEIEAIEKMNLTAKEKSLIFSENAKRILGL